MIRLRLLYILRVGKVNAIILALIVILFILNSFTIFNENMISITVRASIFMIYSLTLAYGANIVSEEQFHNCSSNNTINTIIFKADFSKSTLSQAFGGATVSYGHKNVILWSSGGGIDVKYPAGSYVPSGPIVGGFGVWTDHPVNANTAIFKYSVFFPANFNFVKGGKLPGLYGGRRSCSGGDPAHDCFSTRIMWRENGKGQLYLYANREAQDPAICQMPNNKCNPIYGWSLNTGSFTFQRNAWTDIEETVTLNIPGQKNGVLAIKVNGREVIRYNNIVFRNAEYPDIKVEGMDVETFFGGNGPEWASPTKQVVKFRDFILESCYM